MTKKYILIFISFLSAISIHMRAQFFDTEIIKMELLPSTSSETIEAAKLSPQSKLSGLWYFHDGSVSFNINQDGSGTYTEQVGTYNGIRIMWTQSFKWKKNNGLFRMKLNEDGKNILYGPDEGKYESLNRTEKENLLNYLKRLSTKQFNKSIIEEEITFLDADNMRWSEGYNNYWLLNKQYIERLKKEAKKAEEARIKAEADAKAAKEEARLKAEAEAKAAEEAKAAAEKERIDNLKKLEEKRREHQAKAKSNFETSADKLGIPYSMDNNVATIQLQDGKKISLDFTTYTLTAPHGQWRFIRISHSSNLNSMYISVEKTEDDHWTIDSWTRITLKPDSAEIADDWNKIKYVYKYTN